MAEAPIAAAGPPPVRRAEPPTSPSARWSLVGLILCLVLPSTGLFEKYLGEAGVAAYVLAACLALTVGRRYLFPRLLRLLARYEWALAAATFLLLLAFFALLYPVADAGVVGGGSDRDDALNIAARALLRGRYPYDERTYLGNPISPLPGAVILAVPFVLLGNSAYQNFFWLIAFFLTMRCLLSDRRGALLLSWLALGLSPVALNELVTGGDLLANSLYVLLFVTWLVVAVQRPDLAPWVKLAAAFALGVGLASRASFLLLLPLLLAALVHAAGWRRALGYTAVACAASGLVTIPFFAVAPSRFSPLYTAAKLHQFDSVLPHAWIVIPAATALVAVALAVGMARCDLWDLLRRCTVVLALPVVCGLLLAALQEGRPDFRFAFYGLAFLFFGAGGFWEGVVDC